jgi:lysozyme family protein
MKVNEATIQRTPAARHERRHAGDLQRYVRADATMVDLRKITEEQVATVYRRFYWDAVARAELSGGVD